MGENRFKINLLFFDFGWKKIFIVSSIIKWYLGRVFLIHEFRYGVPYEYDSIMHQNSTLGSKFSRQATMFPLVRIVCHKDYLMKIQTGRVKNTKKMGQRKYLSKGDKELLNKMYCWTSMLILNISRRKFDQMCYFLECEDHDINCGMWSINT